MQSRATRTVAAYDDYPNLSPQNEDPDEGPGLRTIRVFLVIDMSLVRGALAALLSGEDDIEVVAGMGLSDRVVPTAVRHRPDVVVLDVELGGPDMIVVAKELHEKLPDCRLVVLATPRRPGLLVRALDVPVSGAVDTNAQPRRLLTTIRQVARGERMIDSSLAVAAIGATGSPLTPRELAVLDLAAGGATPSEIAQRLFLTRGTVRNYLSRIISKLGARTRIDAIRIAREAGWI
jgi:two-component system, NarL family, response regulator DesR